MACPGGIWNRTHAPRRAVPCHLQVHRACALSNAKPLYPSPSWHSSSADSRLDSVPTVATDVVMSAIAAECDAAMMQAPCAVSIGGRRSWLWRKCRGTARLRHAGGPGPGDVPDHCRAGPPGIEVTCCVQPAAAHHQHDRVQHHDRGGRHREADGSAPVRRTKNTCTGACVTSDRVWPLAGPAPMPCRRRAPRRLPRLRWTGSSPRPCRRVWAAWALYPVVWRCERLAEPLLPLLLITGMR